MTETQRQIYLAIVAKSIRSAVGLNQRYLGEMLAKCGYIMAEDNDNEYLRVIRTGRHKGIGKGNVGRVLDYIHPKLEELKVKKARILASADKDAGESTYQDDAVQLCIDVADKIDKIVDIEADDKVARSPHGTVTRERAREVCALIYGSFNLLGFSYKAARGYTEYVLREIGAVVPSTMIDVYGKAMNEKVGNEEKLALVNGIEAMVKDYLVSCVVGKEVKDNGAIEQP